MPHDRLSAAQTGGGHCVRREVDTDCHASRMHPAREQTQMLARSAPDVQEAPAASQLEMIRHPGAKIVLTTRRVHCIPVCGETTSLFQVEVPRHRASIRQR
jgi:hypothetical protein